MGARIGTARIITAHAAATPLLYPIPRTSPASMESTASIEEILKVVKPPRKIHIGTQLCPETGDDVGKMWMPLPSIDQEAAIILSGGPGTGKSILATRIISQQVIDDGRSAIIFCAKNQYWRCKSKNRNTKHRRILKKAGEETKGIKDIQVYIPAHIKKEVGDWGHFEKEYKATHILSVKTGDVTPHAILDMASAGKSEAQYVALLESILVESGQGRTIQDISILLEKYKQRPESTMSARHLSGLLNNVTSMDMLKDDGVNILDMISPPNKGNQGRLSIISLACSPPSDRRTLGMVTGIVNGIYHALRVRRDIQPIVFYEEASEYLSKDAPPGLRSAVSRLHFVGGRSSRVQRIYCFQLASQVPDELFARDSTPINIKMFKSLELPSGKIMLGVGYGKMEIRNIGIMEDMDLYFRALPPKCDVGD